MKEIEIKTKEEIELAAKKTFLDGFEDVYKDKFLPRSMSDKDKARVLKLTDRENTKQAIVTAIPMICRAEACQFKNTCPLFQEGVAPKGEGCPIEFGIVRHFMDDFIENLNVDTDNFVEMLLVRDMIDQEVQLLRTMKVLAQEDFIQENVVGIDADGDPIMQKQLNLAIDYQGRIHKLRQQLFKQFMATRADRVKAGLAAMDSATAIAGIMENVKMQERLKEDKLREELGLGSKDAYIEGKLAKEREE